MCSKFLASSRILEKSLKLLLGKLFEQKWARMLRALRFGKVGQRNVFYSQYVMCFVATKKVQTLEPHSRSKLTWPDSRPDMESNQITTAKLNFRLTKNLQSSKIRIKMSLKTITFQKLAHRNGICLCKLLIAFKRPLMLRTYIQKHPKALKECLGDNKNIVVKNFSLEKTMR